MSDKKTRYWVGVGYPESMRPDWKEIIGDTVQLPYAYCVHDKDNDGHNGDRKVHVHMILAWPSPTTYKHALSVFNELAADGKVAFNTIKPVIHMRNQYDYLIHDTEDCKKKQKHLYDRSERIEGNNFDIGAYSQLSIQEKQEMRIALSSLVFEKGFTNYTDLYMYVISNFDYTYEEIVVSHSGHFRELCRGNFLKWKAPTHDFEE